MIFLYVRRAGTAAVHLEESAMEDVHPTNGYGKWRVEEGRVQRLPAFYPPERGGGAR